MFSVLYQATIRRIFSVNKMNRPVGGGWGRGSGGSDELPHCLEWKGPLGGLLTNNLTGLKYVSHVEKNYWNLNSCENVTLVPVTTVERKGWTINL